MGNNTNKRYSFLNADHVQGTVLNILKALSPLSLKTTHEVEDIIISSLQTGQLRLGEVK